MLSLTTYQDFMRADDRTALLLDTIIRYKASPFFRQCLEANAYFRSKNVTVGRKTIVKARKIECRDASGRLRTRAGTQDVIGNRIGSSFLFRFITQQNQFLLSNGVSLDEPARKALGLSFDHALERLGERALLHGVAWGFWNADHLEVIEAVKNELCGFIPFVDELTGRIRAGVQFWQLSPDRPMYLRLFEEDGVTVLRQEDQTLCTVEPKRTYMLTRTADCMGRCETAACNYARLPVIPLWANSEHQSEFTPAIRAKIDAYDHILSDFADNLDRANDVYWVLNNFGGTSDDVAVMLEEINRIKAVANLSDGSGAGATAEPRTIEVPYAARETALRLLEKALYRDFMAIDMDAITGGSLTNVAIRAACASLHLKTDRYEWEVFAFVQQVLVMLGVHTEHIRFQRQSIANESEVVADIYRMREDIDRRTALTLNPYIQPEEVEQLLLAPEEAPCPQQS